MISTLERDASPNHKIFSSKLYFFHPSSGGEWRAAAASRWFIWRFTSFSTGQKKIYGTIIGITKNLELASRSCYQHMDDNSSSPSSCDVYTRQQLLTLFKLLGRRLYSRRGCHVHCNVNPFSSSSFLSSFGVVWWLHSSDQLHTGRWEASSATRTGKIWRPHRTISVRNMFE